MINSKIIKNWLKTVDTRLEFSTIFRIAGENQEFNSLKLMKSLKKSIATGAMAVAVTTLAASAQAQTFDDTSSATGNYISAWGPVDAATPTYGETFVAPAVPINNFTFYLKGSEIGQTTYFQAAIYAWTGSLSYGGYSVGSPLFTQQDSITTTAGFQPITIQTGGVSLTPGSDYIALFTTSDPASIAANSDDFDIFEFATVPAGSPNAGGGQFQFYNNFTSSDLASASPSSYGGGYGDLEWTVNSAVPVPEPSVFALSALGGLSAWVIRRRK